MKALLSDRELLGVWDYMRQTGHGGEELLAQVETWEVLELGVRFDAAAKAAASAKPGEGVAFDLLSLDGEPREFDLSDAAVKYLRGVLGRSPQGIVMAIQSANALRRLG